MPRYFEDYREGEVHELGSRRLEEAEIIEFASKYDPLPFHTDREAAARSPYGGLTSSGWLTALVMMRMLNESFICVETSLGSPGIEKLEWLLPVRPGDELSGRVEVNAVRASRTKPEMGFVTNTATLSNQDGALVYRSRSVAIVRTRPR
ncbi:MAG: MaoC family dehydratase [Betaproteobacteria bacterium]